MSNIEMVRFLVTEAHANVNQRDASHRTPFNHAHGAVTDFLSDVPGIDLSPFSRRPNRLLPMLIPSDDESDESDSDDDALVLGLSEHFNTDASLAGMMQIFASRGIINPHLLSISDANSPAYGDGVTRQWVCEFGRAMLLHPQIFECNGPTGDVVISALSDPSDESTSALLRGAGRALGMAVVRSIALGVTLAPGTCKLLLRREKNIGWRDLRALLPTPETFAAVEKCMTCENGDGADGSSRSTAFAEFDGAVLSVFFQGEEPRFAVPSRAARKADRVQQSTGKPPPGPAPREFSEWAKTPVTADTVKEYIETWAKKWIIFDTEEHVRLIHKGLGDVAGAPQAFAALATRDNDEGWRELQSMVQGSINEIDVDAWSDVVQIDSNVPDSDAEAAIRIFWMVVGELGGADRAKLLAFWGVPVLPAGGISVLTRRLKLIVQPKPADGGALLPHAGTCSCTMRIPAISDVSEMRQVIALAIAHNKEFGIA